MVKTKIIATLGPSSNSETVLRKMFIKGLDVARLNFSHGSHPEHLHRLRIVRTLNKKMRRSIRIMQDLEGYRIRIGRLRNALECKKGSSFYLTQESITGNSKEVPFDYTGSLRHIKRGTFIYVDDGKIVLEVKQTCKRRLKVKVIVPGHLAGHKGINIPGVKLDFKALTEKDRNDVEVALSYKLDYVAQSFVRSAGDVKILKEIIKPRHPECKIFAKIESREAVRKIDDIIDESDGIIVARGDLGICIPIYTVPIVQKEIIKKCRRRNKPAVVATQMLDSMVENPFPTRAEVSDVSNAVLDRADYLLLSGETAVGRYPHKAVDMMNKVIEHTEAYIAKG